MEFNFSFKLGGNKTVKKNQVEELNGSYFYPLTQNTEQNNKALIQMYNELPEIQAPVNFIIDSLSNIPFTHYRNDNEVEDSKVIEVINNPNQFQTENDFTKLFFLNRIMLGAGYINRIKPAGFRYTKQMYILPTQNTEPVLEQLDTRDLRLNRIIGYTTDFGGGEINLNKDEVFSQLETSLLDNNYYYSRSRLMAAISTSDSLRNNYQARVKLLGDRGAVGLITPASNDETLTKEEANHLRSQFYDGTGMTGNKYPFHIGGRALNYTPTSMNASELELINNKNKDFEIVCNVLGIDPALFGLGNNTYNNKKLAATSFWENVGIPYYDNYLQLLKEVFQLPKNEDLKADYSQITAMQEDYDKLVSSTSKMYNDGAITQKEYRESTGFEGGEESYKTDQEASQTTATE